MDHIPFELATAHGMSCSGWRPSAGCCPVHRSRRNSRLGRCRPAGATGFAASGDRASRSGGECHGGV